MVAARTENLLREKTAHFYLDTRYRADSWARERRVVIKAEVVSSAAGSRATTRALS